MTQSDYIVISTVCEPRPAGAREGEYRRRPIISSISLAAESETGLEGLSQRFRSFAEEEGRTSSPLYGRLSTGISKDRELLEIASHSLHAPVPQLFFAAVHYLLLKRSDHPLSNFYPDLRQQSEQPPDPYPQFRAFSLENREAIEDLLRTRLVQTNEVRRSALLLPAYQIIASQTNRPLAIIEIGAAAGLNLLWDRYSYDYGNGRICGDNDSEVKLQCELRGELSPPLTRQLPKSGFGMGIDLNPLDVHNDDDVLWLRALVWPEHDKRVRLLESAVRVARRHSPKLLKGDALDVLPKALPMVPGDCARVVLSTFTLNQFSKESREKLEVLLKEQGMLGELHYVNVEGVGRESLELHVARYSGEQKEDKLLARCPPHGEWLEWVYRQEQ